MPEPSERAEAVVPILRRDGRVLVIKRAAGVVMPGYWCPPSGGIEPGESQEDAVVRESREELGVTVTPVEKVWECPTDEGEFKLHWWTVGFSAAELTPNPEEVEDFRWVTPDEFLKMTPTFRNDREFFVQVLPALDT